MELKRGAKKEKNSTFRKIEFMTVKLSSHFFPRAMARHKECAPWKARRKQLSSPVDIFSLFSAPSVALAMWVCVFAKSGNHRWSHVSITKQAAARYNPPGDTKQEPEINCHRSFAKKRGCALRNRLQCAEIILFWYHSTGWRCDDVLDQLTCRKQANCIIPTVLSGHW